MFSRNFLRQKNKLVRSIGKSGFRFLKSTYQICNKTRNPKTDINADKSVFGFTFFLFFIGSEIKRQRSRTRTHNESEEKITVHKSSMESFRRYGLTKEFIFKHLVL